MEFVNLFVIISSCLICIVWALKKRSEIEGVKIDFNDENMPIDVLSKADLIKEQEDWEYISNIFQNSILIILDRIKIYSLIIIVILSFCVWLFLEEKINEFVQAIYFFIGSYSQILIGIYIFKGHKMFDSRIIMFSKITKWHSLDHIIKLNSYITLTNQALNLGIFATTYYLSTFFGIDINNANINERDFERFHRRFMAFGLGSVFSFFLIKSIANIFSQGSNIVVEILSRQSNEGIEEDHPKNPAKILNNMSESFLRIFQNCLEYNALTNMGLCIFQDFFVTRSVYMLDRGFLNSVAIYSFGMLGSLIGMLIFRNLNKFKLSDSNEFSIKYRAMQFNGILVFFISSAFTILGVFAILWNTFPDSIAVYDPFERKIALRNLKNTDAFLMFFLSFFVVLTLIINSLLFTIQNSKSMKNIIESSKVCFSLTLLNSDFWASFATLFPFFIFFIILYYNYKTGNIFGICVEYLGIITFFQIIQFFQNFKNIYFFYKSLIMAKKIEDPVITRNFDSIIVTCRLFGKFSNGVSLFILIILCFVILLDNFNIHIIKSIIVIEPVYIIGIVFGCFVFFCWTSLDIKTATVFSKHLLQRIKRQILRNINEEDYEPPMEEICSDMIKIGFINQLIMYYIPLFLFIFIIFAIFGLKHTVIVIFGCFILVMLICYQNILKSELLIDLKNIYGEKAILSKYEGVDPQYIGLLSNYVGNIYKNFGNDPYSKLLLLCCATLNCSQYLVQNTSFIQRIFNYFFNR